MKKIIITSVCLLALLSFGLAACQPGAAPTQTDAALSSQAAIKVLAVETFLADITRNVAGERAQVTALIPPGVDPHAFEPTPQDVARIADSTVLVLNGAGFETWAEKTLDNAGGQRMVIVASDGLTSREAREGEEAVMSPEEKVTAACLALAEQHAEEELVAGSDAAGAVELHGEEEHEDESAAHEHEAELISLKLNAGAGGYAGHIKFDVAEDGEYLIAANGGELTVSAANGAAMTIEDAVSLDCAGLKSGILLDLAVGEYVIHLAGFSEATTPFFAGAAGGHHPHHESDPHFWLDPLNVVTYVENIRDGLIAADPAGKDIYTANAAAYIVQLNELDAWIKQQVAAIPAERRLIVTNHESFGYFADRYGFQIIGTIIPSVSTGASPSAQQLARLVDHIRESGATALFLETGANPNLAEQLAAETGIKVVSELYTHSITDANGKAPNYLEMIRHNARTIVEALK